jgi:predicted site-specific integrase-resolvase
MHNGEHMPTEAPEYLSTIQVCEQVGFDRSTLSRWIKDGTAKPAMKLPTSRGAYLFTPDEAARLADLFKERKSAAA